MTERRFRQGDKVSWTSHGQDVDGTVEEKISGNQTAAGRSVRSSEKHPQYRVRSDKTRADAVHTPDALRKRKT